MRITRYRKDVTRRLLEVLREASAPLPLADLAEKLYPAAPATINVVLREQITAGTITSRQGTVRRTYLESGGGTRTWTYPCILYSLKLEEKSHEKAHP